MSEKWKLGFEMFNNFAKDNSVEIEMRRFFKMKTIRSCRV